MPKSLPDIIYKNENKTPIIDATASFYKLTFFKSEEYFNHYDSYINFIKGVERTVRQSDCYRKYISFLKNEVNLNRCQLLKNITDEDADIEMHHGPIFTLFDICAIVTEYFLLRKWKITTLRIADAVLDEHRKNRVQVVMVSTTVHQEIHNGDIFINYHQAYGNIKAFIAKYKDALSDEYIDQINRYIDKSLLMDSNDFSVLDINSRLINKKN